MLQIKSRAAKSIFRPFDAEYTSGETLGTGGYAVVKEATHIQTGIKYAVKIMKVRAAISTTPARERSGAIALEDDRDGRMQGPDPLPLPPYNPYVPTLAQYKAHTLSLSCKPHLHLSSLC